MDSIILANILKKLWNGVAVHWVLFFCSSNSSLMPFDPGPFKGCYSVTPTERTFLMRRNIKTSFSNGCSGIFWDESIEGWSKKQDKTSKQTSQSKRSTENTWVTGEYKPRGEHDIIRLRSPTEDSICLKYSIIIVRRTFGSGFIEPLKFMTIIWGVLTMISNYHYLPTNFLKRSFSYRGAGSNGLEPRKSFNKNHRDQVLWARETEHPTLTPLDATTWLRWLLSKVEPTVK